MSNKTIKLADDKNYCFQQITTTDKETGKKYKKVFTVKALVDCTNSDWKTAFIKKQPAIPADTWLTVDDVITNADGKFVVVTYQNFVYYLDPKNLEYISTADVEI